MNDGGETHDIVLPPVTNNAHFLLEPLIFHASFIRGDWSQFHGPTGRIIHHRGTLKHEDSILFIPAVEFDRTTL